MALRADHGELDSQIVTILSEVIYGLFDCVDRWFKKNS